MTGLVDILEVFEFIAVVVAGIGLLYDDIYKFGVELEAINGLVIGFLSVLLCICCLSFIFSRFLFLDKSDR
jgi:hypothetical protein